MPTDQREGRELELHGTEYFPRWIRVSFWVCTAIAVAVVLRRLYALSHPPSSVPPPLAALDAFFASHALLTLAHIIPAVAFVALAPLVVFRVSQEQRGPSVSCFRWVAWSESLPTR